jgi:hypothetical protein
MHTFGNLLDLTVALTVGALCAGCVAEPGITGDAGPDASPDADVVGEPATWLWDIWGSLGRQYANAVAEAEDGGAYLAGVVPEIRDPDLSGGWLARIDPDGRARWELLVPGTWLSSVALHPDGGIVVAGADTGDFHRNGWVAHVDAEGAPAWRIEWEMGRGLEWPTAVDTIRATPDGTFLVSGTVVRGSPAGPQSPRVWIAELTTEGEVLWQRTLQEAEIDRAALELAADSDILLAATDRSGAAWLMRLDRHGMPRWTRRLLVSEWAGVARIDVVETSDKHIALVSNHEALAMVVRFTSRGDLQWQRALDTGAPEFGSVVLPGIDGSVIIGGYEGSGDGTTPDLWLAGMDRDGEPTWQRSVRWLGCEVANDAVLGRDGSIIVATDGCEHAMVLRIGMDGRFGDGCDVLVPAVASSRDANVTIEEVTIMAEDIDLTPTITSFDTIPTTSTIEVLCESSVGGE